MDAISKCARFDSSGLADAPVPVLKNIQKKPGVEITTQKSVEYDVALRFQKQELEDSLHGFLQYGLCLVAKYRDIFPPIASATPKLHTLLRYLQLLKVESFLVGPLELLLNVYNVNVLPFRILVQICKTQAFQKLNPAEFELHEEIIDAVQVSHHVSRLFTSTSMPFHTCSTAHNMTFISDRNRGMVCHQEGFASAHDQGNVRSRTG